MNVITEIIDCFSRLLAWKGFLVTTRLSYAIYLTQFPIYFYNVGRTRSAGHFAFFSMQVSCKCKPTHKYSY